MTFCINPDCQHPYNADDAVTCASCGSTLRLRGRYLPIKTIGQGGFGRTYLALDRDRLDTRCAIKQLLPQQLAGSGLDRATLDKMVELFKHEAMQLSKLGEHPQIPTLFAFFEENSRLYLVQEYIEGQTLWDELSQQGAFSEQKIRNLLAQLLPVLRFIHRQGVVHRDITPVNILRRQRDGKLILIDFGVAKQLTRTSLARPGTKVGTTGYAPLEQLRSGKAYPASDIYSLGVTCIHLLTQTRPDILFDPVKGWRWQEYLARKRVSISDRLGYILDKMLKDMFRDRYQSADEIIRDFKSATVPASKPPTSKPDPPPPTLPRRTTPVPHHKTSTRPNKVPPPPSSRSSLPRTTTASLTTSKPALKTPGWNCTHTLTEHSSWVTCVAISPTSPIFVSGDLDNEIRVWNLETGQGLRTLSHHKRSVNCVAISPNGQLLASGSDDDTVKLWDLAKGKVLHSFSEHFRDVNSVVFTPNGQTVASGSEDRTIKLWKLNNSNSIATLSGASGIIKTIAISPSGQILASGGFDNHIYLWNLAKHKLMATLSGHLNSVMSIAISTDGSLLASGSKDRTVKLWQLPTGDLIHTLSGHRAEVKTIAFHPDGQTLFSASSDKKINVWQLKSGQLRHTLSGHLGAVNGVAVSPDGKTVVSASSDKTVKIWHWLD